MAIITNNNRNFTMKINWKILVLVTVATFSYSIDGYKSVQIMPMQYAVKTKNNKCCYYACCTINLFAWEWFLLE